MLERVWRQENSPMLLVGMKIGAVTMENSMGIPQKIKNRVAIWSSNSIPGHLSDKTLIWNDTFIPMFRAALFTIAGTQKQPKCPSTDEWIKMWGVCVYTHTHTHTHTHKIEYYSTIKNEICSNMNGPID